jgi:uncharacterized membrane protein YidH (DUF202 family)
MEPADQRTPEVKEPADRTRLAWNRTAVAFLAIGGAMLRSAPVAGLVVLLMGLPIWAVATRAERAAVAITPASSLRLVTVTVVLVALAALVVAFFGHSPDSLGQLLRGR